jgi:hypothetical protein
VPNNGAWKLNFNKQWVAIGQQEAAALLATLSEHNLLSTEAKLLLLAISRCNNGGHAEFYPKELGELLGKVDRQTGELVPLDRSGVSRAKKKLFEAGLLADVSGGAACVWLNASVIQRGAPNGNWKCKTHQTFERGYRPNGHVHRVAPSRDLPF